MNSRLITLAILALFIWVQPVMGQEKMGNESIGITYVSTLDNHAGALLSFEGFAGENLFTTYGIGGGQSHCFKREYIVNFDLGYRFKLKNLNPDIRVGFGYLFGYHEYEATQELGEVVEVTDMDAVLTTTLKVGFLNYDLYPNYKLPVRLIVNMGVQGQIPINSRYPEKDQVNWFPVFETGLAFQLKNGNIN